MHVYRFGDDVVVRFGDDDSVFHRLGRVESGMLTNDSGVDYYNVHLYGKHSWIAGCLAVIPECMRPAYKGLLRIPSTQVLEDNTILKDLEKQPNIFVYDYRHGFDLACTQVKVLSDLCTTPVKVGELLPIYKVSRDSDGFRFELLRAEKPKNSTPHYSKIKISKKNVLSPDDFSSLPNQPDPFVKKPLSHIILAALPQSGLSREDLVATIHRYEKENGHMPFSTSAQIWSEVQSMLASKQIKRVYTREGTLYSLNLA